MAYILWQWKPEIDQQIKYPDKCYNLDQQQSAGFGQHTNPLFHNKNAADLLL